MGLVQGSWVFAGRTPPSLAEVAEAFRASTGLETVVAHEGRTMKVVPLYLEIFEPHITEREFAIQGFMPPHRYLWENLDQVMASLGGACSAEPPYWKPNPADARLRTRWDQLTARDQRDLGLNALGVAWKFLAGLLPRGRAAK